MIKPVLVSGFPPGLEDIKIYSSSTQLSIKFKLIKNIKTAPINRNFRFRYQKMSFILLMNVKMPSIVGILTFYEQDKF